MDQFSISEWAIKIICLVILITIIVSAIKEVSQQDESDKSIYYSCVSLCNDMFDDDYFYGFDDCVYSCYTKRSKE